MDTRHEIIGYLAHFLPVDQLADDDDIFRRGFVSSMFAMQLVVLLQWATDASSLSGISP